MARNESDRDDLWAEAVALTSRVELAVADWPEAVVAGYRNNGWCSFYVGQNLMVQFTSDGGLRRAYVDGELYRTQGTTLAKLRRERSERETSLLRHDLSEAELAAFRTRVHTVVRDLRMMLETGHFAIQREVTTSGEKLTDRVAATLAGVLAAERFLAPAIPGKR